MDTIDWMDQGRWQVAFHSKNILLVSSTSYQLTLCTQPRLCRSSSPPPIPNDPPEHNTQSFFGGMGCCMSVVLSVMGAAYGIAKSGVGVSAVSVLRPDMIVRSAFVPALLSFYII